MENITIEKMEIKRFNALLMRTIVGMLFMGVLMWETFCLDTGRKGFLGETWYIFAFAVLLYVVVAIRASDILERIKKDKKLMGALDSEIYSDYNSKALTAGFYAAMQMGLLVYCFGDFFNLSVRMGALVIVVVAMLFSEIRRLLLYNPYKELLNKIKVYRAMKNISQEELAIAIGVTRKTINTVETGKFIPSTVLALRIARYFGVPVEEIFVLNDEASY